MLVFGKPCSTMSDKVFLGNAGNLLANDTSPGGKLDLNTPQMYTRGR